MTDIEQLTQLVHNVQSTVLNLTETVSTVTQQNTQLRSDVEMLKSVINRQASTIVTLEQEIDNLDQYGRRENVVFTNLKVTATNPESQVIELCKQIGVDIERSDLVACHPLPSRDNGPTRIITRFHERETARKVFSNRKKSKLISGDAKEKLASRKEKGFGILPNLTIKRNKLFSQVKKFNESRNHEGCWVDTNTGKILLRVRGSSRGKVIKNTRDLVELDNAFVPDDCFFCSAPTFTHHNDLSPPVSMRNLSFFTSSTRI